MCRYLLTKGSKTFTYNSANQITNAGYTYDANGNLTSDGNFIYVYNALNQLVQVKKVSDGSLVATYTYNHNGLRKSKTVNGVTTTYNWDASGNLIRESNPSGSSYYYWVGGNLVGLKKNDVTYITHTNLRGDIESITDTDGNIVAQAHYDPWGNQIAYSGSLVEPFRYAGYYFDDETGLYYLKSRYYSPALGRFLSRDGIGFIKHSNPQTLNLYSYCGNNPVSLTDPDGKWASKAEQDWAYKNMDSVDYNEMCRLGFNWETGDRAQIEADANNIRAKYKLPAFGSNSKSVLVQETVRGVARLWTYDYFLDDKWQGATPEIVHLPNENQIYSWVPKNYVRIGLREDKPEVRKDNGVYFTALWVTQVRHYDYGPPKR